MLYLTLIYDTSIYHATFDPWYLTPVFDTDIFHAIFDTDACHDICDMWPWYWYLPYYIWHVISDPDICLATLITWHWTPILDTWRLFLTRSICYACHMIYYTGIWHTMLATWYLTYYACHLIFDMLCLPPGIYNTDTYHDIHDTWYLIPGTWHLTPVLPDICMIIITRHLVICTPVLLYSCTPVFLYSCTLILLYLLYSCSC